MSLSFCGALGLLSCTTSSGGTYSRSVNADEAAARKSKASKPAGSNGSGNSNSTGNSANSGAAVSGSIGWSGSSTYNQDDAEIIIVIDQTPRGTVKLQGLPFGTPVLVDGQLSGGNVFDLLPGQHHFEVRAFGSEIWEADVEVEVHKTSLLTVTLIPASFHIIDVDCFNRSFNPGDPGYFGQVRLRVNVTTPGAFQWQVLDSKSRLVTTPAQVKAEKASTDVFWNGHDEGGRILPPGQYTLLVQAQDQQGAVVGPEYRQDVFLNDDSERRTWVGGSGFSGPFFVPDAKVAPEHTWTLSTALVSHLAAPDEPIASTLVWLNSLRASLNEYSEISLLVTNVFRPLASDISTNWTGFTGSWKMGLSEGALSYAVGLRGTFRSFNDDSTDYYPPAWDGLANFDGLSITFPMEYSDGPVRLFIAPEVQISSFYPFWTDNLWPSPDLFVWSTLRFGLEARLTNPLRVALSAAMKSEPLNKGSPALQLPLSIGAELSLYTNSPVNFTAYALGEAGGPYSYAVYGGIGVGVQF